MVGCSGGASEDFQQGGCEEPTRMVQGRDAGCSGQDGEGGGVTGGSPLDRSER